MAWPHMAGSVLSTEEQVRCLHPGQPQCQAASLAECGSRSTSQDLLDLEGLSLLCHFMVSLQLW